jgi:hypothetical protein
MMKKLRRRLERFLGSSSDLSELSSKSNGGVHLISASSHSRLPPTHQNHNYNHHHSKAYNTDINRNPKKSEPTLHFNELSDTHYGLMQNGVAYHPNGNIMTKSMPNGLHNKPKMHMSASALAYNNDHQQFAYRNQHQNPQYHNSANHNGNRYHSRPSSVYSLYNSNMQVCLFIIV